MNSRFYWWPRQRVLKFSIMAPLQTKGGGNEDHPTISHRPQVFNFKILALSFALFCLSESVSESVRESGTYPAYRAGPFRPANNLKIYFAELYVLIGLNLSGL